MWKNVIRSPAAVLMVTVGLGLIAWLCSPAATRLPLHSLKLQTIDGNEVTFATVAPAVTLVQFWSIHCSICIEEQPQLSRLYRKYHRSGLEIVAITMPSDRPDLVLAFVRSKHLAFPVALDINGVALRYFDEVIGTPTTFVFDHAGNMLSRKTGRLDFSTLEHEINRLLQRQNSGTQ